MQKKLMLLGMTVLGALFTSSVLFAAAESGKKNFDAAQRTEIGLVVRDYLLNNPQLLVEVSQKLQTQALQQAQSRAEQVVRKNKDKLFSGKNTPVAGNPKGNIQLVEFYDYACSHCQHMVPVIAEVIKNNPNLRVSYKVFPVRGPNSEYASRAFLAAVKQGDDKAMVLHKDLFSPQQKLEKDNILKLAKSVGLDVKRLETDMNDASVTQELSDTAELAKQMEIPGTPSFVIASQLDKGDGMKVFFVPGAIDGKTLQEMLNKAGQ